MVGEALIIKHKSMAWIKGSQRYSVWTAVLEDTCARSSVWGQQLVPQSRRFAIFSEEVVGSADIALIGPGAVPNTIREPQSLEGQ